MKKAKKYVGILAALALVFGAIGCSSDDEDEKQEPEVVLQIEENAEGFVNTTGSIKTNDTSWIGFSGAYIENLTIGTSVVYAVTAKKAISDAKIAIHYANWQNTNVRGAYVYVNGTLVNEDYPISMTYTNKGGSGQTLEDRWIDTGYLTGVSLKQGSNTIILMGAPAATYTKFVPTAKDTANSLASLVVNNDGQLSNIDYLIVSGKGISAGGEAKALYKYSFGTENENAGTVESDKTAGNYEDGTTITVTATPKSNWNFECWSDGSKETTHQFTLSATTNMVAHFIPVSFDKTTALNGLVGYATITNDNNIAYTITGGAGGNTIEISSLDDLTTHETELSGNTPYIVKFTSATRITTTDNKSIICKIGSNKTIYGATAGAGLKNIEMRVSGDNVIIRNMIFGEVIADDFYKGDGNDALALNGAHHVWVDHCELYSHLSPIDNNGSSLEYVKGTTTNASSADKFKKDFYDGLLDLKNGASWITISNCYLHDHWKAFLCGSGDSHDDGDSNMRLTITGCFFKNINSRQPLFRWGKAHIYNNYFLSESTATGVYQQSNCIDVRVGSTVLAEANYFSGVKNAIGIDLAGSGTNGQEEYSFPASNVLDSSCKNTPAVGSSTYVPPYSYTPADASTDIANTAGATLTGLSY